MDDVRQERLNKRPSLTSNKRSKKTSPNKKFGTHIKESMVLQVLKK